MIAHLDADAFFASVEQHQKPSLASRPVLVGGTSSRGVVAAASYQARAFGVRSAMSMPTALSLCPTATVVRPRFEVYRAYSAKILQALGEVSGAIEPISIDEAFADWSGRDEDHRSWEQVAAGVQERALELAKVPVSIGVGRSKMVAKLASDAAKPAGVKVVAPEGEDAFLLPLAVRALWGVGPVSAERLEKIGIRTVADLRRQPLDTLQMVLGASAGLSLYQMARGVDDRPVLPPADPKSAGAERTFDVDLRGREQVRAHLPGVAAHALERLAERGAAARTVTVKVRFSDFTTVTRAVSLTSATADGEELVAAAHRALGLVGLAGPVRLLGVAFSGFAEHAQPTLDLPAELVVPDPVWTDFAVGEHEAGQRRVEPLGVVEPDEVEEGWRAGQDVTHPRWGRGWVVRLRDDGRVAVRFESVLTGPGRQLNVDAEDLTGAAPLGPDGAELAD